MRKAFQLRAGPVQVYTLQFSAKYKHSSKAIVCSGLAAIALAGCAQPNSTPLPDLKPVAADTMLKPAQQQQAINDLARKKAEAEAQAVKTIESQR